MFRLCTHFCRFKENFIFDLNSGMQDMIVEIDVLFWEYHLIEEAPDFVSTLNSNSSPYHLYHLGRIWVVVYWKVSLTIYLGPWIKKKKQTKEAQGLFIIPCLRVLRVAWRCSYWCSGHTRPCQELNSCLLHAL